MREKENEEERRSMRVRTRAKEGWRGKRKKKRGWEKGMADKEGGSEEKICPNTATVNRKIPNLNMVTLHRSRPVL